MPIDPVSLAISATTSGINNLLNVFNNKKQYDNTVNMFNMQHQAAIDDWNRNNEYNSPKAQMGRFAEAGLNPNLIYGQMTQSPAIKSPDVTPPQREPMRIENPTSNILAFQQLKQSAANTNLIEKQALAAAEDAAYKQALTRNVDADTALKNSNIGLNQFELGSKNRLLAPSLEAAELRNAESRQRINEIQARTSGLLQSQEIAAIMREPNKQKIIAEIANIKSNTANNPYQRGMWTAMAQDYSVKKKLAELETENQNYDLQRKLDTGSERHDSYIMRQGAKALKIITDFIDKKKSENPRFWKAPWEK